MSSDRLITPPLGVDEEDLPIRPQALGDFIGQESLRGKLTIYVAAAKQRGEPLDHILFHGPPGLGKTTLAGIIAREMGGELRITTGPALERSGDLAAILSNLQPRDVLFIDPQRWRKSSMRVWRTSPLTLWWARAPWPAICG